jgi:26S proteasome regulatory subunit N6
VRHIVDQLATIPDSAPLQTRVVEEAVAWCRTEKRSFLRIRLEMRLADLSVRRERGGRGGGGW